jgi:hypothetical protein
VKLLWINSKEEDFVGVREVSVEVAEMIGVIVAP